MEMRLREFDRCRTLYEKFLENDPRQIHMHGFRMLDWKSCWMTLIVFEQFMNSQLEIL